MKRIMFALVALLFLFISCAPKSVDTEGVAVTVNDLLGDIENTDLNVLKIIEFYPEYMVVELNGERHTIVPDSSSIENQIYFYFLDTRGTLYDYPLTLFAQYFWNSEKENYPSMEYVVFRDYERCNADSPDWLLPCALQLVLVRKSDMPKVVDLSAWDGSKGRIVIWNYPTRFPRIVLNVTTNEIAFISSWVLAIDDQGNHFDIGNGQYVWGYLYSQEATNHDPELVISQSERK